MARKKIGFNDNADNSVGSNNIIDETITIDDIKTQDTGDASAINAETLPFEHDVPGTSIHDAISAIVGVLNITVEKFIADGILQNFTLANTVDTSNFYLIFFNGQLQKHGASDDFTFTSGDTVLTFNFVPENAKEILILYVAL